MYPFIRVQFPPKRRAGGAETSRKDVEGFSNVPKGTGGERGRKTSGMLAMMYSKDCKELPVY